MIDPPPADSEGGTVLDFGEALDEEGDWRGIAAPDGTEQGALHLALDGWEGPLDLLLELARKQ